MNFYKRSDNRLAKLFCSTLCGSSALSRLLNLLSVQSYTKAIKMVLILNKVSLLNKDKSTK